MVLFGVDGLKVFMQVSLGGEYVGRNESLVGLVGNGCDHHLN